MKRAVSGGSVPDAYIQQLRSLAATSDMLTVQTDEDVDRSAVHLHGGRVHVNGEAFDQVILATGMSTEPMLSPLYQQIQQEFDAPVVQGLPQVDEALRWVADEDLFVLGANAGLQLGPGALNLMGAMRGAKLVADELRDLVWTTNRCERPAHALQANAFSILADAPDTDTGTDDDDSHAPLHDFD